MASSSTKNECYLFFGVSGAGKSATINKLCGEEKCQEGDGETSETQNCKLVHVENKNSIFYGKSLLDMQGYNDTRPEENQAKIFEMMKLYFMGSQIKKVRCIIFVVNMSDAKTNFYLRFINFLKQLFSEEQVTNNMLVLLTKGDRLSTKEKEQKLANIQGNISEIENRYGYSMEMVEWSNEQPLLNQEKKLLAAASKLPGFDPTVALQAEEKKIDAEVEKQYEAEENITIVKHDAKKELEEFRVDREVEENIPLQCDEIAEKNIPAVKETCQIDVEKIVHFEGHVTSQAPSLGRDLVSGALKLGGMIGTNYLATAIAGRQTRTQTEHLHFEDPVLTVTFDKSPDDIYLLDKLDYTINSNDRRQVTITANFSWGGAVILSWDFDLKVTATVEHTAVVKEGYIDKIVVSKQRIEKVTKTVTDIDKRMIVVQDAYEEKLYKRTKEEIRKAIIDDRILKMT